MLISKVHVTQDKHSIAIKRSFFNLESWVSMPTKVSFKNKGKLRKECNIHWAKSLPWPKSLPMAQNYLFIAISFYRNIVCKNVSCDMGLLNPNQMIFHFHIFNAGLFDIKTNICSLKKGAIQSALGQCRLNAQARKVAPKRPRFFCPQMLRIQKK